MSVRARNLEQAKSIARSCLGAYRTFKNQRDLKRRLAGTGEPFTPRMEDELWEAYVEPTARRYLASSLYERPRPGERPSFEFYIEDRKTRAVMELEAPNIGIYPLVERRVWWTLGFKKRTVRSAKPLVRFVQ